ncbi:MAG TPA: hypothetical protein VFN22_04655 [Gemmatimonadales bacterium]|nr:hypothetical protein [Gemmatimonadales bacterium]
MTRRDLLQAALAAIGTNWLAGCAAGPPTLAYDVDECAFCRMTISDRRFGAAARSATGRTVRFDSIECLAGWVEAEPAAPRALWVTDAMVPGVLVPISTVRFHRAPPGTSPMGRGYLAVTSTRGATAWDGERLSWAEIRREVAGAGVRVAPDTAPAHGGH